MSIALRNPISDLRLCLAANRWGAKPHVVRFFALVSRLGDGVFWYSLMAALAVLGGTRGAIAALHMALAGMLALASYRSLKQHYRRPRPFAAHSAIVPRLPPLDEFSFPSGHTLHAVTFSLIACTYFPLLALVLLPFTLCVAASRVVLGLHYPSDVLAATAIGVVLAAGSFELARMIGLG